ncbi:MAG: hypothetical protein V3U24_09365 [Candidatus Neomarinimicrobiota bacterium]
MRRVARGRLFSQIELLLWLGLAESRATASLYKMRLHSFAAMHGGTNLRGKSGQYIIVVGDYDSMDAYNETQQRRREPGNTYRDRQRFNWSWDSEDNRKRFRRFRVKRDTAKKVGQFLVGAMVLNRVVSVIDVRYLYGIREKLAIVTIRPTIQDDTLTPRVTVVYRF